MKTKDDLISFLKTHQTLFPLLRQVASVKRVNCWISAGVIRNAVWDHLFETNEISSARSDVDVIYFDPKKTEPLQDREIEVQQKTEYPGVNWSVRNQARMHLKNQDPAYQSLENALEYWPETATAIAARYEDRDIEIIAPFGVEDLLSGILRVNPLHPLKRTDFEARKRSKNWQKRWPDLIYRDSCDDA
ncbi:nucleotidyltransferase family protein [Sneathiella limimaris]|uniref:nucleotidyltransferase family protein n=1 Tax=Sneathiella limimaris TaxID=1964213 RepID=UPI00146DA267|nr:nucleotidyltransferase family protein [Sneathiella limimaris]